jgi:hypothetical protein
MFSHLYPIFFFLLTCASLSQKGHKGSRIWRNVLCNTDGQVRTGLLYLRSNLCAISLYDMVTVSFTNIAAHPLYQREFFEFLGEKLQNSL